MSCGQQNVWMIAPELNIAELPLTGSFLVLQMVSSLNDVKQNIEKTLNNTHATTQKLTNNGFSNTKKHPINGTPSDQKKRPLIKGMITKGRVSLTEVALE